MALKDVETKPLDPTQVRELSTDELQQELRQLRDAHFRLRFRSAMESVENTARFRMLRRNIARLATILREREQA